MPYASKLTHAPLQSLSESIAYHLPQLFLRAQVVDDLGWSDSTIQPVSAGDIRTPHLKQLADTGIRFANFYTQPVCSPSRSALMTGRYPFRDGMQHEFTIQPATTAHVPLSTPMLAEKLKSVGYQTHAIGKVSQNFGPVVKCVTLRTRSRC